MIERLKEARDAKSNLEEGFRQEVRAQTRLAELHQKQASDAEEKSQKLTAAITGNYFSKFVFFMPFMPVQCTYLHTKNLKKFAPEKNLEMQKKSLKGTDTVITLVFLKAFSP